MYFDGRLSSGKKYLCCDVKICLGYFLTSLGPFSVLFLSFLWLLFGDFLSIEAIGKYGGIAKPRSTGWLLFCLFLSPVKERNVSHDDDNDDDVCPFQQVRPSSERRWGVWPDQVGRRVSPDQGLYVWWPYQVKSGQPLNVNLLHMYTVFVLYYYWSLLHSAILRSRADSLRSHVILHGWIAFYSAFLNIHRSGVLTALAWLVPQESAAISARSVYTIQPCTVSLHAKPHT